jgi:glutathione synthase/RimK-type ligase-like ATP-grasp enzyme
MSEPILLIGAPEDAHVEAIAKRLSDGGVEAVVVDTLSYPEEPGITLGHELHSIAIDGRPVARPAAVYLRDFYAHPLSFGVDLDDEMDADWRRTLVALREKAQILYPLLGRWYELGVPIYNPTVGDWRYAKPFQLALLQSVGLPVPETIWTNDPEAVRRFAADRRVIYKPVAGGAATRELGPEDLTDDRLGALKGAPVTFQELLQGDNFRVYCLDGEVIAAIRVVSEEIDFRQNEDVIEQVDLPSETLNMCLKAAETLGMRWTGMDLRADAEGAVRFLELNSSPMFLGFDAQAGTNILERLVGGLAAHAR